MIYIQKKKRWKESRLKHIYYNIKYRCYTLTAPQYNRYGGRGICMFEEWKNSYESFEKWALENGYKENLCIDRIDNDGNYEPNNCQWITVGENTGKANKIHQHRHANGGKFYYAYSPCGQYYKFENANKFAKEHNLNANCIRRVARGERQHYKQWKFGYC